MTTVDDLVTWLRAALEEEAATFPDGTRGDLAGLPLVLSEVIPDGEVWLVGPSGPGAYEYLALGTGPISNSEWCRREALRIVRTGLADVLDWLGEPPWRPPATGLRLLARMKDLGVCRSASAPVAVMLEG